jgi:ABC-type cobalamin/Fe3+-siderophores transport system ATPase subunit
MRTLRSQGAALLMTNHEPDVVLTLADDVLLIDPNGTTSFGPLEEVFTTETLSRIYDMIIRLVKAKGHRQVVWI